MTEKLALLGGPATITQSFRHYNPISAEEVQAAKEVIESGVLSQFIGAWHSDFLGGPKVKEFEAQCARYFGIKHAITVNSWTSGLIAAVGAIGIQPGDEVIVTPWTMCASATAILHWNAIPVFADIDPITFCLDPKSVEVNITPYTKAIMAVDIFGMSADMDALMDIAKRHGLKVISDTAQAPGARYKDRYAGTLPFEQVTEALRGDHWLALHPEADAGLQQRIRQAIRDAFYTDTDAWRAQILQQADEALAQAVRGLQGA